MRELKAEELETVAGGTGNDIYEPPPTRKGNNGWGNGADGTNKGSFKGGTAGSKSDNTWTTGDGPRPKKFTTR